MKCLYGKTLFIHNLFAPLQKVIRAIITQVAPFGYGEKQMEYSDVYEIGL